jgi:hypothetical protein
MFHVGLKSLSLPVVFLYLHDIKRGWWKWYRGWRNNLRKFGGWMIFHSFMGKLRRDNFYEKLGAANRQLAYISRPGCECNEARTCNSFYSDLRGRFCKDLGEKEVNDERRVDNVL